MKYRYAELLGRVVDAFGKPIDGKGQIKLTIRLIKVLLESKLTRWAFQLMSL